MKRFFIALTPLLCCQLAVANPELAEQIRPEAQAWAQNAATLEQNEQEALTNFISLQLEVARQDQRFRKFMAAFLNMTQAICEQGLQQKEPSYKTMDVTKRTTALLTTAQLYHKSCNELRELTKQFEQDNVFCAECIDMYNQLKQNMQDALLGFLQQHSEMTNLLLKKNKENLLIQPQLMNAHLHELFLYTDKTVQTVQEDQRNIFKINMLSLAADIVWKESFAGIQTALQANKQKEILQDVTVTLLQIYDEALKKEIEVGCASTD